MDHFICNKCFATLQKGKKPFCLTQCGHIYCQGCIRQAEQQCPQCQQVGIVSIPLQEPLLPKISNFFQPIGESLATLEKVDSFQTNQIKIVLQRFHEIDKKYELLKGHYYNLVRNAKILNDKYFKLKAEKEHLQKRHMIYEMRGNSNSSCSDASTPLNSSGQRRNRITPHSHLSQKHACKANLVTPNQSFHIRKECMTSEGFRIPSCLPLRSGGSRTNSETSSTYTFGR